MPVISATRFVIIDPPDKRSARLCGVAAAGGKKVRIGQRQAVAQFGLGRPAQFSDFGDIQELSRHAVGARRVVIDFAIITYDVGDQFGEFA